LIRRRLAVLCALPLIAAGCSEPHVITTGGPQNDTATAAPTTSSALLSNALLVNAFDYAAHVGETTGYYFTTPSGKWRCAILTHTKAGCQAASSWESGLGVEGEPDSTNAIVVGRDTDPQFVTLEQPEFWLASGTANTLQFNRILAAAGFRCNVQEAGVSCQSDATGKGFTFSTEGFAPQYTDVPAGAP
jgi:hypothetical protein